MNIYKLSLHLKFLLFIHLSALIVQILFDGVEKLTLPYDIRGCMCANGLRIRITNDY